ncbi:MAG: rhomboid family intramembrane serine protease [SAR86 cluster bacterium]|nr:rhomboid family intramembrane serine protease [SAR86 cluster bacterium]
MFFFPFSDDNPTSSRPIICYWIIGICIFIFLWQFTLPAELSRSAVYSFGVIPSSLLGDNFIYIPASLTVVTSMFMHGGWMHLLGNMLYLWIFGDNIEESLGRFKFIVFYSLCGLVAALTQSLVDPTSNIPMIGASGAIAGVLGGYLILYPRANVNVLFWIFIFIKVFRIPAFIVLGVWIVGQFFDAGGSSSSGVAYFAHIGGFLAGICLVPLFKKPSIPLFQNANTTAFRDTGFNLSKDKNFMQEFIDEANKKDKR